MLTPAIIALAALASVPSPLSPLDHARGFNYLNGHDYQQHWRSYKGKGFPDKGWAHSGDALKHIAKGGGGDIITTDEYGDFEMSFEYMVAPGANSGVKYHCNEKLDAAWMTGPEFQILDDAQGEGGKPMPADGTHSTAAMYDLIGPPADKTVHPSGEWNTARIYFRNGVVQHWLNDKKVVEMRLFDDQTGKPTSDWLAKIAGSKFKAYEGFGILPRGHIGLQDHGDEASYRMIMVRDLDAPMPGEVRLFNGKDLSNWLCVVPDLADQKSPAGPESVWNIQGTGEHAVLVCKGKPTGYIRTIEKYDNFILRLQWRFNPETKQAGNSGVLLRMTGNDKVWPKSVEAQLQSGQAGDFWNIDEVKMTVPKERTNGRNTKATHYAERPIGEWNEYEIICLNDTITLYVNGEELNKATGVEVTKGHICLQSEGAEIQFRDIRLAPLK